MQETYMCAYSSPGKLEDRASLTRLDTELGPRGNRLVPEGGGVAVAGGTGCWARRRAMAANVSNNPAAAGPSGGQHAPALKLGTLTLIGVQSFFPVILNSKVQTYLI